MSDIESMFDDIDKNINEHPSNSNNVKNGGNSKSRNSNAISELNGVEQISGLINTKLEDIKETISSSKKILSKKKDEKEEKKEINRNFYKYGNKIGTGLYNNLYARNSDIKVNEKYLTKKILKRKKKYDKEVSKLLPERLLSLLAWLDNPFMNIADLIEEELEDPECWIEYKGLENPIKIHKKKKDKVIEIDDSPPENEEDNALKVQNMLKKFMMDSDDEKKIVDDNLDNLIIEDETMTNIFKESVSNKN